MIAIWKNKKAFFHIPKTAGSTARAVFNKKLGNPDKLIAYPSGQHHPLQDIRDLYKVDTDELDIYTIIRNPYQHVISLYMYVISGDEEATRRRKKNNPKVLEICNLNFSDYIDWYCKNWRQYKDWLFVDDKLPKNITIWKMESIGKHLKELFGSEIKIPHIYNMKNKHYSEYFNRQLYDKINKKYEWCFSQGFYKVE